MLSVRAGRPGQEQDPPRAAPGGQRGRLAAGSGAGSGVLPAGMAAAEREVPPAPLGSPAASPGVGATRPLSRNFGAALGALAGFRGFRLLPKSGKAGNLCIRRNKQKNTKKTQNRNTKYRSAVSSQSLTNDYLNRFPVLEMMAV